MGMVEWDWFEEDPEDDLSDPQREFLAALRVRARSWACTPDHTQLVEPGGAEDEWCALMDVSTKVGSRSGNGHILVTIAVAFNDTSVHGGEVHSQNYHFVSNREARVDPLPSVSGTPELLAATAADWFEQVMARPVLWREWHRGERTYGEYVFADTGVGISGNLYLGTFNDPPDRVVRARGVFPD